ncbi:MAG: alkaline phosphatase [Mobiluncus sp.]|uniref:cell wall-binding repeat-containing protein n=1 Tax=Mobiluncus sp. TaxID=47293 RepID=UPI00258F4F09|nr:cell wall-binding repeat-containing protein [Mobiluncus sp.]MCI6584765.1 alkaline phosphatase [Mobiluncus sp.]
MSRSFLIRTGAGAAVIALIGSVAIPSTVAVTTPAVTGPKNVFVMIGDGMGYNELDLYNAFTSGKTYYQVDSTSGQAKMAASNSTEPRPGFQGWNLKAVSTYSVDGSYDSTKAWAKGDYLKDNPTDSAAAATALSGAVKTYNAAIGVDNNKMSTETILERAKSLGKSAGVISSVPYSHATPAGYAVHNATRKDYHGIAHSEIYSQMDVVMGPGHPLFDDGGKQLSAPDYGYISEADFNALRQSANGFKFIETKADFEALTSGNTPAKVFGIPQVASTLQQGRPFAAGKDDPTVGASPLNANVPSLETMTKAALNVLDNNANGVALMVEGGAIDWAGHANQTARSIEETTDFVKSVEAVINWVEKNSNWNETLMVVTADHETGYLMGAGAAPGDFRAITGKAGETPAATWLHDEHTNQLVPWFMKGAGADKLRFAGNDPVRGQFYDDTEMARVLLDDLWFGTKVANGLDRAAGFSRYNTSAALSKQAFPSGAAKVFLASGENYPDALSAAAVAGNQKAPVLLVRPSYIPREIGAELSRLNPKEIVVVGGPGAVADSVLNQAKALTGVAPSRAAGADRFATSADLSAKNFPAKTKAVYVATGVNFPDALSAAPAAAKQAGPVLLTASNQLPTTVAAELKRLAPSEVFVVGGAGAVSDATLAEVSKAAGVSAKRVSGADRYGTSVAISQAFAPAVPVAYVATGVNFPDALSAGAAAGAKGGPVLLTTPNALPGSVSAELKRLGPANGVIAGGTGSVSNVVADALSTLVTAK